MHALLIPSWFDTAEKPWRGTFFRDQARALVRQGVKVGIAFVERRSCSGVRFATLRDNHFQSVLENDNGIAVARMKAWSIFVQTSGGARLWSALTTRLVDRYVKAHGVPDIIHAHAVLWGGYAASKIARILKRPFVLTEHSSAILANRLTAARRRIVARVYDEAAEIIAVSGALERSMRELTTRDGTIVLPNTVDAGYFKPPSRARSRSLFRFLAVCDLVAGKRIDLLIQAFASLVRGGLPVALTIVGTGEERERLERLALDERVREAIHFTDALTRDGVRREMWRANALVCPSDCETFGVVLIEALATGLPVIATRSGGPAEIVKPPHGYLIDTGDAGQLATAMKRIMHRRFDGAELHAYAARRYGYDRVGSDLVSIYRDIIGPAHDTVADPRQQASCA